MVLVDAVNIDVVVVDVCFVLLFLFDFKIRAM